MHIGYVGERIHRKGNGKTCTAVLRVAQYRKARYRIYSNIHLQFQYTPITPYTILQLRSEHLRHSVIFLDEIQNWFSSLGKGTAHEIFGFIMNQTRKTDTHILWTSQRLQNVPTSIRDDATIYLCRKYHPDGSRCFDQEDRCPIRRHVIRAIDIDTGAGYQYELTEKIYKLYNTDEVVDLSFYDHRKLRKAIRERTELQETAPKRNFKPGNHLEEEFIKILKKNGMTKITHNSFLRDAQFDIETRKNSKILLFDIADTYTSSKGHTYIIAKHKNWRKKIEEAKKRNAEAYLIFPDPEQGLVALPIIENVFKTIKRPGDLYLSKDRRKKIISIHQIFQEN